MNFGELRFWLLLGGGLLVIAIARGVFLRLVPQRDEVFDKTALACLGLILLLAVSWLTWIIFVVVFLISYFGLKLAVHLKRPKSGLFIILPVLFAPLIYYKYADFIARGILRLEFDTFRDLLIPVGISFYTFQKAAAVIDTLVMKKPIPRFIDYLNFAAFFPQIVAGPIERREDLLPQMEKFRFRFSLRLLDEGLPWIITGLFMKRCLADNFGAHFLGDSNENPYLIWMANLMFGLRIYYDFAGYSLIALGVAKCLGVNLRLNFESPYCSTSIAEFWRRWHITLSQWFRDYLYVPLGGSRVRWWAANIFIVFVVSGIWHGAGWNFLIWGMLHAIYLIIVRIWDKRVMQSAIGWLLTMTAVFFAWMFFYETRPDAVWQKASALANPSAYNAANLKVMVKDFAKTGGLLIVGFYFLMAAATHILEWMAIRRKGQPFYYHRQPFTLVLLVVMLFWFSAGGGNDFIYFAF